MNTNTYSKSLGFFVIFSLVSRETFGGVFRYYLGEYGISEMWFFPDLLASLYLGVAFYNRIFGAKEKLFLPVALFALMFFPVAIGYFEGNDHFAVFSSFKSFVPLFFLILFSGSVFEYFERYFHANLIMLVVAVLFVIANPYVEYDWIGATFDQFGQEKEVSRLWWDGTGNERIAGAASASFSAAISILFLYLAILLSKRFSYNLLFVFYVFAVYAVYLTTYKTAVIAFLFVPIFIAMHLFSRSNSKVLNSFNLRSFVFVLMLFCVLIPIFVGGMVEFTNYEASTDLSSFAERWYVTWPGAFRRLYDLGGFYSYGLGSGFGSFGVGSYYSGKYIAPVSDVDSFFLFAYCTYGFLSIPFILLLLRGIYFVEIRYLIFPLMFALFGVTTNCEGPIAMIILGAYVSGMLKNGIQKP